ncbi:acyl-CoA dehydrogenase [Streptomyces malaysiensis]|uniref:Acyl-CoA dehydrogenase family protein n=1 Tax=Streptomyces malaysiensis subsp. samsunensis TaxID=459658 RepID=A0A9X2LRA9_STRMQ|nr:acyl-CoA dehydrogenase [Streptomyces samsunensis]MCQ8827875.1 acyl-CoA dehydrogenase family protein [Streptomyces samsunensis]
MEFMLDQAQTDFGRTLDRMLGGADTPRAVRAWARGEHAPGRAVWGRLAEAGVTGLAVPEAYEGVGPLPVELGVAYVAAGRHAVPGPLAETAAAAVLLAALAEGGTARAGQAAGHWLPRIADGRALVTLAAADGGPYALDADAADAVFAVEGEELWLAPGHGPVQPSFDPARRLARPLPGGEPLARGLAVATAAARAADWAAFATAALSLGTGLALVERTAAYVKQRTQFGRPIGSFQAVKHRLADALIGLEFARPLLYGAAVALASTPANEARAEVAAAKVAAGEAAYTAARTALQLHGALGYTEEYDLSLWIRKARALRTAWGSPSVCRSRVLTAASSRPDRS